MDVVVERCAFLDVYRDTIMACARTPDGAGGRRGETVQFRTTTSQLLALATCRAGGDVGRDGSHRRLLESAALDPSGPIVDEVNEVTLTVSSPSTATTSACFARLRAKGLLFCRWARAEEARWWSTKRGCHDDA